MDLKSLLYKALLGLPYKAFKGLIRLLSACLIRPLRAL